jgi:ATP-dependent Clp protease ATP-binding subunit ClpA
MFERFTDRARRAVVAAQDEARMLGHNHIGSEHLLLGLLHLMGSEQADVLAEAGVTLEAARAQVAELAGPSNKVPAGLPIPFTPRAKKVLELSLREALEQRKGYIGTEHILLAVLRDSSDLGAQILQRLGGSPSALRQRVLDAVRAAPEAGGEAGAEEEGDPQARPWNWQVAHAYGKTGFQPSPAVLLRKALTPIEQRLAAIERHLGIPADEDEHGGMRALLTLIDRHLTSIEHHLGLPTDAREEASGTPDEPTADEPTAAD